ncbi:MAG TPA: hypothetical protein VN628_18170 [Vicinamibacterales bacterium]|nr:hypothetical protein [Vicinamibacterales bacterium]
MKRAVRRVLFGVTAVVLAGVAAFAALLGVDVYLHGRYQTSAGFNVWGYRGAPVGRKQPGEYRVVILGGSSAYGYGVTSEQAIPATLERLLRARAGTPRFTVVNLAYNNEGAYSFKPTLEDYDWLGYDLAVLYEGYNDLGDRANVQVFRHDSPVFRLTGYMPIFPIIFKEKAAAMVSGGDPGALYRQDRKIEFHAGLATKAGADVLNATANVAQSLEQQLGRVATEPLHRVAAGNGCAAPWTGYCASVRVATDYARSRDAQVLIVTQPYLDGEHSGDRHRAQQAALASFITMRFASDPDVRYVNLGPAVDLANPHLSFDHMHLRAEGNQIVAAALVQPVLDLAAHRKTSS